MREISLNMKIAITIIIVLVLLNFFQLGWNYLERNPAWDAIPTEEAALEVGKALINSIYGKGEFDYDFSVTYDEKRNAWYVCVILPDDNGLLRVGATAGVLFRRSDAKILEVNSGM